MRNRNLAAAVLAAAVLSIGLTGVASATTAETDDPPGEGVIATCVDGVATTRPVTEADREKVEAMRERAGGSGDGIVISRDPALHPNDAERGGIRVGLDGDVRMDPCSVARSGGE
jgi:hypothetical protein